MEKYLDISKVIVQGTLVELGISKGFEIGRISKNRVFSEQNQYFDQE
jgi:hypothetical protein